MKSNFVGCDNRSGYRSLAIDICRVGNIRPENFVKIIKIATPVFLTIAYDYYYSICLNKDILKRNGTSGDKSMDTFLNILSNISNRRVKPESWILMRMTTMYLMTLLRILRTTKLCSSN